MLVGQVILQVWQARKSWKYVPEAKSEMIWHTMPFIRPGEKTQLHGNVDKTLENEAYVREICEVQRWNWGSWLEARIESNYRVATAIS